MEDDGDRSNEKPRVTGWTGWTGLGGKKEEMVDGG